MISYKFTIQEIVAILMNPYVDPKEFIFWITYEDYLELDTRFYVLKCVAKF